LVGFEVRGRVGGWLRDGWKRWMGEIGGGQKEGDADREVMMKSVDD
jgi:hypothetical protein